MLHQVKPRKPVETPLFRVIDYACGNDWSRELVSVDDMLTEVGCCRQIPNHHAISHQ